jgi:hypothetical protein
MTPFEGRLSTLRDSKERRPSGASSLPTASGPSRTLGGQYHDPKIGHPCAGPFARLSSSTLVRYVSYIDVGRTGYRDKTSIETHHSQKFDFVMGDERGKSIRDRIGHSEFVQAAVINVGASGYRFVGGGEKLRLADPTDKRALSEILEGRAQDVHECISAFLNTFRSAVILRL